MKNVPTSALLNAFLVLSVACRPYGTGEGKVAPPAEAAPAPLEAAVAPAAAQPALPTGATTPAPGPDTGVTGVVELDLPDFLVGGSFEPWEAPSAAHPRGTLVLDACTREQASTCSPWLLELDLGTREVIARANLRSDELIGLARDHDHLHAGVTDESKLQWVTYGTGLTESRRLTLPAPEPKGLEKPLSFAANDKFATMVTGDGLAYLYNAQGNRIATRDCRPLHGIGASLVHVDYTGDLAIVSGGRGEGSLSPTVCAFRWDGGGALTKVEMPSEEIPRDEFVYHGQAYLSADGSLVRRLGRDLRPRDPPEPDPRPDASHCRIDGEHIRGDYTIKRDQVFGLSVVTTGSCCGGPPGGFFLCYGR